VSVAAATTDGGRRRDSPWVAVAATFRWSPSPRSRSGSVPTNASRTGRWTLS